MPELIYPILGCLAVSLLVYWWKRKKQRENSGELLEEQENMVKILDLARRHKQIACDDVQIALGVADVAAEWYLDELVGQGRLVRVGASGKYTVYKLSGN